MTASLWSKIALSAVALITLGSIGALLLGTERDRAASLANVPKPSAGVLEAAAAARAFFGHQSVGQNVITGIPTVYARSQLPMPEIIEMPGGPPDGGDAFIWHALIGENGNPRSKMVAFEEVFESQVRGAADVALMKFCYLDINATTDVDLVFSEYTSMLERLQREFPDTVFVASTVPLTTDRDLAGSLKALLGRQDSLPADNAARQLLNERIRSRYRESGRLWDIATVESTRPDGSRVTGRHDGLEYEALYRGYASDPGHLNEAGSALGAAALLEVIASNADG